MSAGGSGSIIRVDTDMLRAAARQMERIAEDVDGPAREIVVAGRGAYGDKELAQAAADFALLWQRAAESLPTELRENAEHVRGSAATYDQVDAETDQRIKDLMDEHDGGWDPAKYVSPPSEA